MQQQIAQQRSLIADHDLAFLAGAPVIYHCHHFNLFWDQTIDDALGPVIGNQVRTRAAHEAFHELLSPLSASLGLSSPLEKLNLAEYIFSAMGHGKVDLGGTQDPATVRAPFLHYSHAWNEKYGKRLRRKHPADAFAAGFAAAAREVAFDLPIGSLACTEHQCKSLGADYCTFEVAPTDAPWNKQPSVIQKNISGNLRDSFKSKGEETISEIAGGLREFAGGVQGDERGLIEAFGLLVTQHPSTYYNRGGYDALRHVEDFSPNLSPVVRTLLRESGHVCVFNTFGGILLSPEWEAMVGPLDTSPEAIITFCCAIARALGFGHWCIEEFSAEKRLVVSTPSTYESVYYQHREQQANDGVCHFLQGAGLAMMQLAHRVPWAEKPALTEHFYGELFRRGVPWRCEEVSCVSKGDDCCRIVVEPRARPNSGRLTVD